jgi:hypothetical protein
MSLDIDQVDLSTMRTPHLRHMSDLAVAGGQGTFRRTIALKAQTRKIKAYARRAGP